MEPYRRIVRVEENLTRFLTSVLSEVNGGIKVRSFMPKEGAVEHVNLTADRTREPG
jgi:hypothetical protein